MVIRRSDAPRVAHLQNLRMIESIPMTPWNLEPSIVLPVH